MSDDKDFHAKVIEALSSSPHDDRLLRSLITLEAEHHDQVHRNHLLADLVNRYAEAERQLVKANELLRERQARLDEDLLAAAAIQTALLPKPLPPGIGVITSWQFAPCEKIGGDVLLVNRLGDHHLMMAMIDVTGHGVPAAMVTVSVSQFLQPGNGKVFAGGDEERTMVVPPHVVLEEMDREFPFERFDRPFSIFYAVLDLATGEFRYSNGGHPRPYFLPRIGETTKLDVSGTLVGLGLDPEFPEDSFTMRAGDRLFLYTDGLSECRDSHNNYYGEPRIMEKLTGNRHRPIPEVVDLIWEDAVNFASGGPFQDDCSIFGLEYSPGGTHQVFPIPS